MRNEDRFSNNSAITSKMKFYKLLIQIMIMTQSPEFISNYDIQNDDKHLFHIEEPKKWLQFVYISSISLVILFFLGNLGLDWIVYIILPSSLISYYVTPNIWNKVVEKFIKANVLHAVDTYNSENPPTDRKSKIKNFLNKLLGIKFEKSKKYYIEARAKIFNLNHFRSEVLQRVMDLISSCLSITFLFLTVYLALIDSLTIDNIDTITLITVILIFISPILTSFVTPIIWTLQDVNVRSISNTSEIESLAFVIRNGVFRKFLGISGIFLGYGVILEYLSELIELNTKNIVGRYFVGMLVLLLVILIMALPNLLLTLSYSKRYHEINVNLTRNILKTSLPIGITSVRKFKR